MKTEGEIRQKIKQAQFRHIKRILKDTMPEGEVWSRDEVESIKNHYTEFFSSAPVHIIAKDFPDVAALMWVLGDHPDCCLMVGGSMVGNLGGILLWADSDPEGEAARSTIDSLFSSLISSRQSPPPEESEQAHSPLEAPDLPQVQETLSPVPFEPGAPREPQTEFDTIFELHTSGPKASELQVSDSRVSDSKVSWFAKVWDRVFK